VRASLRILKWIALSVVTVFAVAAVGLGTLIYVFHERPFRKSDFDQVQWRAAPDRSYPSESERESSCERGGMARDLQHRYLRPGTTREQVVALLGVPDGTLQEGCIEYSLGMCSGFRIDYDNLRICFAPDGRLIKSTIQFH
jgi:hypothetical protein